MASIDENVTQENEIPPLEAPRGLKILVIVLGIAIVVMLALIIFKIADNVTKTVASDAGENGTDTPAQVYQPAGDAGTAGQSVQTKSGLWTVNRPQGMTLKSVSTSEGETQLHFSGTGGDVIILLDTKSGKEQRINVPANSQDQ